MFVAYCWALVVGCWLCAVWLLLFVFSCLLSGVWCLWFVVCCLPFDVVYCSLLNVGCWLWVVGCGLFAGCWLLFAFSCLMLFECVDSSLICALCAWCFGVR